MRIMLDTNVLLSAILFPSERMNRMMRCIFEEHRLVLSSFVVDELGYTRSSTDPVVHHRSYGTLLL